MIERIAKVETMFGEKFCTVLVIGNYKDSYSKNEVLWVERPEDMYALMTKNHGFRAVLHRQDWINGTDIK